MILEYLNIPIGGTFLSRWRDWRILTIEGYG